MSDFEKAQNKVVLEMIQKLLDEAVRFELERFHEMPIIPCGILIEHDPETLDFDMVQGALDYYFSDKRVPIQRIELSKIRLFKKTDEGDVPLSFVKVWYYLQKE